MAFKIIADKDIPFLKGALELYADIYYYKGSEITNDIVKDADALIVRTRTLCNKDLLEGSSVKFIATSTIGFDHIDTKYCEKMNIAWTNAPGCNSGSVLQYVASALLSYAREKNIDLTKRVLGVVGVGNVGKKIVQLAEMLGMYVILNDPPRERKEGICGFISLDGLLREADIISFHVPLINTGQDKTFHLAGSELLLKLNPNTLLINSSRGEIVDTKSLYKAHDQGHPADIILDVWEDEPGIDLGLLNKCYIGTPHIAGYSSDGKAKGTKMSVQELSNFFELGLDAWEPFEIPVPQEPVINCNGNGKTFQEILTEIVLHTYDVSKESNLLRNCPEEFELYRSNYSPRREFLAYSLELINVSDRDQRKLQKLGFNIR